MKLDSIFVDCRNKEHVKWWNEVASKLVKVVRYDVIVETATEKPVGYVFKLRGLLAQLIIKQNNKFLGTDAVDTVLKRD